MQMFARKSNHLCQRQHWRISFPIQCVTRCLWRSVGREGLSFIEVTSKRLGVQLTTVCLGCKSTHFEPSSGLTKTSISIDFFGLQHYKPVLPGILLFAEENPPGSFPPYHHL